MLFLQTTIVNRPLCPTFIHDEPTRMVICVVGLVVCFYALYRVMRHFDEV